MDCKTTNGTAEATWKYIKKAYVPAVTVCLQKLDSSLQINIDSRPSVAIVGLTPPWSGEDFDDQPALRSDWLVEVQEKVISTNFFAKVDIFDALQMTPTLNQLLKYDSILVYSDEDFLDGETLGDVIADYCDTGRGVVTAVFEVYGDALEGRWKNELYDPIGAGGSSDTEITLDLPPGGINHPILKNVQSFDAGVSSFYGDGDLAENTTVIAEYNNTAPLIAVKTDKPGKIVLLNFYPPSNESRIDFWKSDTDGALLMGNALKYCAS